MKKVSLFLQVLALMTVLVAASSCEKENEAPCGMQVVVREYSIVPAVTGYPYTVTQEHLNCAIKEKQWGKWADDSTYVRSWQVSINGVQHTVKLTSTAVVMDVAEWYALR